MSYPRMTLMAVLICVAAGCSKSNPVLGKWKLAPNASPACSALDGVEFNETSMTMDVVGKQTANVTYGRDGDHYLVNAPNGTIAFEKIRGGIKSLTPFE